jgi:ribosome biogenesis GTPase
MRVFGLGHLAPEAIPAAFVDLRPRLGHCRFRDCRHDREPGCAVQEAAARGEIARHRVALMHAMIAESRGVRPPGR